MKTAFITRSTLFASPGGDTIQVLQTARFLRQQGIDVDILRTNDSIRYADYDLLHFLNLTRPADILFHINRCKKPFVISPILVDYSEYDRQHREGLAGRVLRRFSPHGNEYIKTCARWIARRDTLQSKAFLWKGQFSSIREIIQRAAMVLPNSISEYERLSRIYQVKKEYAVVPNGVDETMFYPGDEAQRNPRLVLCAARIEGIKNQLNLIRALNGTHFTVLMAGAPALNQKEYYQQCRKEAANNIFFNDHLPQDQLLNLYRQARVHVLPSWFETCGLSSLEAAAMGCNLVITDKGYTRDYFQNDAVYCHPEDPSSIHDAVVQAASQPTNKNLQDRILTQYTWRNAARLTASAYQKILSA